MSRTYALPFKNTNPRTVMGAASRGWHVVEIERGTKFFNRETGGQLSWFGLEMWTSRHTKGYWVNDYSSWPNRTWAFEKQEDASMFIFQWNL